MDRVTRRKMKHDKFVEDVGSAYGYVRSHPRPVVWGVAVALVLAVLLAGFVIYQRTEESRAQQRLAEAIEIMDAPLESQAAPNTSGPKYKTEQEKLTKAQPIFQQVAKDYSRTDAADVAELYLARIAAERGDVAAARPKLEQFVREHPGHILAAAAKRSLYDMRLAAGEVKQVLADLEQELSDEKSLMPDDVVLALQAQALERNGEPVKAREKYQRIINEFPDSPYTIDAQRKLAQG